MKYLFKRYVSGCTEKDLTLLGFILQRFHICRFTQFNKVDWDSYYGEKQQ